MARSALPRNPRSTAQVLAPGPSASSETKQREADRAHARKRREERTWPTRRARTGRTPRCPRCDGRSRRSG